MDLSLLTSTTSSFALVSQVFTTLADHIQKVFVGFFTRVHAGDVFVVIQTINCVLTRFWRIGLTHPNIFRVSHTWLPGFKVRLTN